MKNLLAFAALNACTSTLSDEPYPIELSSSLCSGFPTKNDGEYYEGHSTPSETAALAAVEAEVEGLGSRIQNCYSLEEGRPLPDDPFVRVSSSVVVTSEEAIDFYPTSTDDDTVVCTNSFLNCSDTEEDECKGVAFTHAYLFVTSCYMPQ